MPTYYEVYSKCSTEREMIAKMKDDTLITVLLGSNPDRLKAIEDAWNKVSAEKGWAENI